jgi:hypothetical protein
MYFTILIVHSLLRWLILAGLIYMIYISYNGWFRNKQFTNRDNTLKLTTVTLVHIQLLIGVWLYFISPIISMFFHNFKELVHDRQIRFFGIEHNLMMLAAIILITIGSVKAKNKPTDKEKFKTIAIWFTIGLIIILISIPWPFSPLASRPFFRF